MSEVQAEGGYDERDDRPLSPKEYSLLQRLLSDPTLYPRPMKTWLISYLESSDFSLPFGAVLGLKRALDLLDHRLDAIPARQREELEPRLAEIERRLAELEARIP